MDTQDPSQAQAQPDILQMLASLLQPSEADAASRRPTGPVANVQADPSLQLMHQLNIQLQQQRLQQAQQASQQRAQQAQQQAQLRSRDIAVREQKQQAGANPPDISSQLTRLLGGQSQAAPSEEAPIFSGVTPGTGTPYFSNFKAPEGYAPEPQRQQYLQDLAGFQARQQAAAAQKASAPSQHDPAQVTRVAQGLKALGIPDHEITLTIQNMFPGFGEKSAAEKPLTPEQTSKLWKFNPDSRDFEPVPPELSHLGGKALQEQGYRVYTDKQRGVIDELKDTDVAFQQLKSAVADIKDKSAFQLKGSEMTGGNFGFGSEGAVFKKAATNFTTIFDKFLGGVRGAASPQMQAIRSQVLPQITSSGQVSDRLMSDLDQLIQTMGDSRLKTVVGGTAFNASQLNRQAQNVLDTFKADQHSPAGTPGNAQSNQLIPGERKAISPSGRLVAVPPGAKLPPGFKFQGQ